MSYNLPLLSFLSKKSEKESEVAQLCPTLCDPMDCSPPGSSVHGIFWARILEWVAISFSRESSCPRDRTQVSHIAGRRFNLWATREALSKKKGLTNIPDKLLPKYIWSSGDDGLWGPEMHQAGPSLGKDLLPTSRDKGIFQGMPQLQRAVLPKVMSFPEGQPTSRDWDRVIKSQPHQHNTGQP